MNDTGEAAGIRQVFEAPPPICALKPFTGHTLGACGVNELALFSLALNAGFFPATRGFKTPDPSLGLSPSLEALPASDGHYLLNYFGFGGNNSSLILERRS
jgi:3-oxoacyl-[acyl-carrier-protein] synthase-1